MLEGILKAANLSANLYGSCIYNAEKKNIYRLGSGKSVKLQKMVPPWRDYFRR